MNQVLKGKLLGIITMALIALAGLVYVKSQPSQPYKPTGPIVKGMMALSPQDSAEVDRVLAMHQEGIRLQQEAASLLNDHLMKAFQAAYNCATCDLNFVSRILYRPQPAASAPPPPAATPAPQPAPAKPKP